MVCVCTDKSENENLDAKMLRKVGHTSGYQVVSGRVSRDGLESRLRDDATTTATTTVVERTNGRSSRGLVLGSGRVNGEGCNEEVH